MTTSLSYFIVDAFTTSPFNGNPAAVVLLDGNEYPDAILMKKIAGELRYSETAFVIRHSYQEYTIRYFTTIKEVELCGHATIATFYLLFSLKKASGQCLCHTIAGDIFIECGNTIMVQMLRPRVERVIEDVRNIYNALGLKIFTPHLPIKIVSTGLPDILVQVPDVATLNQLKPNMNAVSDLTALYNAVSIHAFAFGKDQYTAHVRNFAPFYGIPEESATGTSNSALAYYLKAEGFISRPGTFSFIQGEAMGRQSVILVRLTDDDYVFIGGSAVLIAKGSLYF